MINEMRQQIQTKKRTLKAYEQVFRKPEVLDPEAREIAQRCERCTKQFATWDHLAAHYKRRHLDYYVEVLRPREDEALRKDLGEIVAGAGQQKTHINQDDIVRQIKEDVVDRFNSNFVLLQNEVQSIRLTEKEHIDAIVTTTQQTVPESRQKISSALQDYELVLKAMQEETKYHIQRQQEAMQKKVDGAIQDFLRQEKESELRQEEDRLQFVRTTQEKKAKQLEEVVRSKYEGKQQKLDQEVQQNMKEINNLQQLLHAQERHYEQKLQE